MTNEKMGLTGPRYEIHTDGSCVGNPGPGGFAWVRRFMLDGEEVSRHVGCDAEADTTNQRMEMLAAFDALAALGDTAVPIFIFSDSQYLIKGMTEWLPAWKRRGWRKSGGGKVMNKDLWVALEATSADRRVTWTWTRGHAGNPLNELVDGLATEAAETMARDRVRPRG